MRRGIWQGLLICIVVATLSNAGATGTESAGHAFMSGLHYDRYTNAAGVPVNWVLNGPTPPLTGPSIWLHDIGNTTADAPAPIGDLTAFGGTFKIEGPVGHGVTGTLGRSDHGTVDQVGVWYSGATTLDYYYCQGTYDRHELIFRIVLDCSLFRIFVGTPVFTSPHLEVALVLVPSKNRLQPLPPHPTQYGASYGVFTAA